MQLSDSTLDILRNFSSINQNILIKADSPIKTISEARNVVAKAEIPEKFVKDFFHKEHSIHIAFGMSIVSSILQVLIWQEDIAFVH